MPTFLLTIFSTCFGNSIIKNVHGYKIWVVSWHPWIIICRYKTYHNDHVHMTPYAIYKPLWSQPMVYVVQWAHILVYHRSSNMYSWRIFCYDLITIALCMGGKKKKNIEKKNHFQTIDKDVSCYSQHNGDSRIFLWYLLRKKCM